MALQLLDKLPKILRRGLQPFNLAVIAAALLLLYIIYSKYTEGFTDEEEQTKGTDKKILVLFYAPWCGHCKALKPEWDKVERKYSGHEKIQVKKVNCDENPESAKAHGVDSFPTIILFSNGEKKLYEDDRTAKAIESFMLNA